MFTIIYFSETGTYEQAIVGESNYQSNIDGAYQTDGKIIEVDLQLEDLNRFDKNAVMVAYGADIVGYLPREDALKYRSAINALGHAEAVGTCKAKIIGGGEGRSYGVILDLDIDNMQVERIDQVQSKSPAPVTPPEKKDLPKPPVKFGGKLPTIPMNGKGWAYWLIVFPFVAVINLYILLFAGIWYAGKWIFDGIMATETKNSKKPNPIVIALIALFTLYIFIAAIIDLIHK